jgi:class 3 adenylate cyclase
MVRRDEPGRVTAEAGVVAARVASFVAVLVALLAFSLSAFAASDPAARAGAQGTLVTPIGTPAPLPAESVWCASVPGLLSVGEARAAPCHAAARGTPAEVWFRFSLAPGGEDVVLVASDIYTVKGALVTVWSGGREPVTVGAEAPLALRPVRDGRPAVVLARSPSGPTEVIVRAHLRDSRHLRAPHMLLSTVTRDGWAHQQTESMFAYGILLGMLTIMCVYNAFLWYAERERASAWYMATATLAALYFVVNGNVGPMFLWPGTPGLSQRIYPPVAPLMAGTLMMFARSYAELGPRASRALRGVAALQLLTAVFATVVDPLGEVALAATVVNAMGTLALVTLFVVCLPAAQARGGPARVLLASSLGPLLGVSGQIGIKSGWLPDVGLWPWALPFGVVAQITVLGVGLADRVRRLRTERDRSEAVLRLALPAAIAERLKAGEVSIADRHEDVAVLFADLAGFTSLSADRRPEEVVRLLDALFSEFDLLAKRVGAEKVKTIGDCYMVIAGAPAPHPDPVGALAEMALELDGAAHRALTRVRGEGLDLPSSLPMRVGLHVGPVVAGVLGHDRLAYDLWGDTVNLASRMESHGVIGRVQCTAAVRTRLLGRFELEPRGSVDVRGKGSVQTWFLVGPTIAHTTGSPPSSGLVQTSPTTAKLEELRGAAAVVAEVDGALTTSQKAPEAS